MVTMITSKQLKKSDKNENQLELRHSQQNGSVLPSNSYLSC